MHDGKAAIPQREGAVSKFFILVAVIAALVAGTALFARNESRPAAQQAGQRQLRPVSVYRTRTGLASATSPPRFILLRERLPRNSFARGSVD